MSPSQAIVGATGVVVERVRGGDKPGEVRIVVQGLPHHYLAHCTFPLEKGQHVVVVNNRGGRQLDVEPWPPADFGVEPAL